MLKNLLRFATAMLLALPLAACGIYVRSDVNHELIGSVHCGSYAWAGAFRGSSPLRGTIANPLNEDRLRSAITAHVPGGAVQPVGSSADCLIGYGIGSNYVIDGAWPYGYGWGYGWGWAGPYVYREGIIAVDLYDAKSRKPLWHAAAEQSLYGLSGAEAGKRIDAAVAAIFSKYPR
ncbi:MAG: DUF4136 domain-containing protein [Gammaproteobacteria bacterium]|nr:DUF4136 domain-containing protein [Gammaproteobacteria bacterium]MBV9619804.1 DUF4136 domain-containing protein [Gammaproteobacteria bacterium]